MIFDKFRMASDLERIKASNSLREEDNEKLGSLKAREAIGPVGIKDYFAMVIAIFSLLLPYVAVFMASIVIFSLLIMGLWG